MPRKKKKIQWDRQQYLLLALGGVVVLGLGYFLVQQGGFGGYLLGQSSSGWTSIRCEPNSVPDEGVRLGPDGVVKVLFSAKATGLIDLSRTQWSSNDGTLSSASQGQVNGQPFSQVEATFNSVGRKAVSVMGFAPKGATFPAKCYVTVSQKLSANPNYTCVGPTKPVAVGQTVAFHAKRNDGKEVRAVWQITPSINPNVNVLSWGLNESSMALSYNKTNHKTVVSFVDPETNQGATCPKTTVTAKKR